MNSNLVLTMLLTLDIGNTNIAFGVFDQKKDGYEVTPKATWRIASEIGRMSDEYSVMLRNLLLLRGIEPGDIKAVILCSGVPPLTKVFVDLCSIYFGIDPLIVGTGIKTGIRILYDNPRDVGSDRICDAVATLKLYGGPAIIVDFGTATVFDAVSGESDYLGGAIAPGVNVSADALFHNASQLRRVELARPSSAIGKNTVHAMQSGLVLGYADMVKGMISRFDIEMGGGCKVVATGGLADLIEQELEMFDVVNPDLTLVGLCIIYCLNS